jgi:DNA-binding response OmpR family regulator
MKRVLIVDDNRDADELLALLMRAWGHQVMLAYDATAALAALGSFHPDLVLLDIGLPGMNGFALARELRQRGCSATLAAITSYGGAEDRQRSLAAGIDHYFVKPVDSTTFGALLT